MTAQTAPSGKESAIAFMLCFDLFPENTAEAHAVILPISDGYDFRMSQSL